MKDLKCDHCGSGELVFEEGVWVCRFCGSRYMPESGEIPKKAREEELVLVFGGVEDLERSVG